MYFEHSSSVLNINKKLNKKKLQMLTVKAKSQNIFVISKESFFPVGKPIGFFSVTWAAFRFWQQISFFNTILNFKLFLLNTKLFNEAFKINNTFLKQSPTYWKLIEIWLLPGSEDIFYSFHMTLDGHKEFFLRLSNK